MNSLEFKGGRGDTVCKAQVLDVGNLAWQPIHEKDLPVLVGQ